MNSSDDMMRDQSVEVTGHARAWAKASASGHGQALVSQRDMMNQDITIKDSFVLVLATQHADEALGRAQYAKKLLDEIDELKRRLAILSQAAKSAEARLTREAERARVAGRAQALAEAQAELRDAERRRREIEARLEQAEEERGQAVHLMRQAQRQALDARSELEELRRAAQLEADLAEARLLIEHAANEGGTVREDAYDLQLASADAELGGFRQQLAMLSAELEESTELEDTNWQEPSPPAADALYDLGAALGIPASAAVPSAVPSSGDLPPVDWRQPAAGASAAPPSELGLLPHSRALGAVLFLLSAALFTLAGTYINIMLSAPVGPAVVWQIVFTCAAFAVSVVGTAVLITIMDDSEMYIGMALLLALPILIAANIFPSRDLPGFGPVAQWLVYHLGPM